MAKTKKYKSNAEGAISVSVPGHSVVSLEPGDEFETDDAAVQAALDANSDVAEAKGGGNGRRKSSRDDDK